MNPLCRSVLLAAAMLVSAQACAPQQHYFQRSQAKHVLHERGSLAVISVDSNPASIGLAAFLTTELQSRSTFRVLSQQEIAKRIPDYPAPAPELPLNVLHEKLETEYLFMVGSRIDGKDVLTTTYLAITTAGLGSLSASVSGRLFHYPGGVEVGNSHFRASRSAGLTTAGANENDNEAAGKLLQEAAAAMVGDLLEHTRPARTSR